MNVDRRRARRLAAQLHDMRSAACALSDGVFVLDASACLRWCNPAGARLLGLAWPGDRGTPLAGHLAGGAGETWQRLERGDTDEISAPGDANVRLQLSLLPFGDGLRLLLAHDVSQVRRLEQVRRDFVANVSHELRTPLTVIHGYLELLDPEDVPALAPVLREMRVQSQRMRQIVEDLLVLSHLEMQEHLDEERVEMTPLLESLRREAEALSQGRHRIALLDQTRQDLLGSGKELHSAFSNLVSNAVRYTPSGGSVTIVWRQVEDGAEYAVIDTGYGIPAEHLPRLTERFYRVSSSRSRASGGTGLGLSIVKHVLNLHEAQLEVRSEPGKGSTFACRFAASRLLARH